MFDFVLILINFIDEVSLIISKYREYDSQLNKTLQLFEIVSSLLSIEEDLERRKILLRKGETMAEEIKDLNEEKLNCTLHIKHVISTKHQEFKFNNVMHYQPWDLTPEKFVPQPGTSTPFDPKHSLTSNETKTTKKRGRKPLLSASNELKNSKQESVSVRDSVESSDLMMLADVALIKREDEKEASKTAYGKLPVTKRVKKNVKNRKLRQSKSTKDESDSDSDIAPAEGDENEPLYCLCNRVSFGPMIECDNDACSIEWFVFNAIFILLDR